MPGMPGSSSRCCQAPVPAHGPGVPTFEVRYYEIFIPQKSNQTLAKAAQRVGGGVTIPGGSPEPWECGTEGHEQWA